jgi:transposase
MDQGELEGMPEPAVLRLVTSDGHILVTWGRTLVYRYEVEDIGMRNLAIVALTDAGRRVDEVAGVFGLTATYVSMLRGRARLKGSAGLVRRRGRPRKLSERQVAQARAWAGSGWTQQAICERLGVARSVISDLLARVGPAPVQESLPAPSNAEPEPEFPAAWPDDTATTVSETETRASAVAAFTGSARIGTGSYRCRYAGAMLLYPYLHRVGAQAIFATLTSSGWWAPHTGVSSVAGPKATNLEPALVASLWEGNVGPLLARLQATMIEACRSPGRMPVPLCRRKDAGRRVAGVDAPSRP